MRILFVSNYYPPIHSGGYELRAQLMADAFAKRGHSVQVLTSTDSVDAPRIEGHVRRQLPIYNHQQWKLKTWQYWQIEQQTRRIVQQTLRDFRPDVIYIWNMWHVPITACTTLEASHIPIIYQIDHNWLLEGERDNFWLYRWQQSVTSWRVALRNRLLQPLIQATGIPTRQRLRLDEIIFISSYRQQEHEKALPVGKNHLVYTGIPMPAQTRQRTDFDHLRLLFVARYLLPMKGVHTALEAFSQLASPHITLDIYGEYHEAFPDYNAQLAAQIEADEHVTLCGLLSHDDLVRIYQQYDALLFCSNSAEGMPLVIVEAFATGVPVIGSPAGGAAEMLMPEASLTYAINDATALADHIQRLHSDSNLWHTLSTGARHTAETVFNVQRALDETEAILEAAAHRKQ